VTRTVVSFEAPEESFPTNRGDNDAPPGREIAALVSKALSRSGIAHEGPLDRGGWAWDVAASSEHATIESTVGFVDDAPIQWLIVTTSRPRRRFGKRARVETEEAAASMLDLWIRSILEVTSGPHGLTTVRWYDQKDFDYDHGDTWAPTPFE